MRLPCLQLAWRHSLTYRMESPYLAAYLLGTDELTLVWRMLAIALPQSNSAHQFSIGIVSFIPSRLFGSLFVSVVKTSCKYRASCSFGSFVLAIVGFRREKHIAIGVPNNLRNL